MLFDSVHTSQTGLLAFSQGLDLVSTNVTNINTPGFKGSDQQFRDLFYRTKITSELDGRLSTSEIGTGVRAGSTSIRFSQGDLQSTTNDTDAAIDGNGFFILGGADQTVYTRVGEFEFDDSDRLVARDELRQPVSGIDEGGNLVEISIAGLRSSPPQATTEVDFVDNLSLGSTEHTIDDVDVFDSRGATHRLSIRFENNAINTAGSWLIDVRDELGAVLAENGEVRFQGNGSPAVGFNAYTFAFAPVGADSTDITLFMGEPGSFTGATSFAGGPTSTLAVESQNGRGAGALIGVTFDARGDVVLEYSNEATATAGRLALAWFRDLQSLQQIPDARFLATPGQEPIIGPPAQGIMGQIVGENIELSNVDLTQEFTDLIILQRGFQASSQTVTVANEMIQSLLDMERSGR